MIRPAAKHTLKFLGGAFAVLALGIGVLAFKLAAGPVPLKFMTPTFAALLKQSMGGGYGIEVADAELTWSQAAGAVAITLEGVNLYDHSGLLVAGIPELEVGLSVEGLRYGVLAPTSIRLQKASVLLERGPEGDFSIGSAKSAAGNGQSSVLPLLLNSVFAPSSKRTAASYLSEVVVQDADLTVIDRRTGLAARAPDARFKLLRTEHGFTGNLEATVAIADQRINLVLNGAYDLKAQTGSLDASFSPVRLSRLAPLSEFYASFTPLDMPIGGKAHLDLGQNALITRADLSLSTTGGRIAPQSQVSAAVDVETGVFEGTYWPASGEISVDVLKFEAGADRGDFKGRARLRTAEGTPVRIVSASVALTGKDISFVWPERFPDAVSVDQAEIIAELTFGSAWRADIKTAKIGFGPARIEVSGELKAGAGSPAMRLDGLVSEFPAPQIARYWPRGFAVGARDWVANHIQGGRITRGKLTVDAPAGAFAAEHVDEGILKFVFRVEDVQSSYLGALPPIKDADAQGTLTAATFDLTIETANILDTRFSSASISIEQLGVHDSPILIEAEGAGRVEQILAILNNEPLNLVTKYGLTPGEITGDANLRLTLSIPQSKARAESDLRFTVAAKGEHLRLPRIGGRITVDSGTLDLKITEAALEGSGRVAINGAPADVIWREQFRSNGAMPSEFKVHTVLDEEARAALGFDTGMSLTGPVVVDLRARGKGLQLRAIDGKIDLARAAINLTDYGWTKPAGAPVKIDLDIAASAEGAIHARQVRALGRGVDISGSARLASDGKLLSARFPRLQIDGLADIALSGERTAADGLLMRVDGAFLRLGPILKEAASKSEGKMTAPWHFEASLQKAILRNAVETRDLRATVASAGGSLKALSARGRFEGGTEFSANLIDIGDTTRRIVIEATDAGRLIGGVTGIRSIVGGRLSLNARIAPAGTTPATSNSGRAQAGIEGSMRVDDFKVVDTPLLARLLNIGSLQGLSDLLNGEGIQFTRLQVPFWIESGAIGIDEARAAGPALGVTVQGVINRQQETTELNGSIVPAYTLNSALGSLPVLGPLLISRQGEGVFGFTYSVTGEMKDPRLVVNPLAALAPGFLRRLFELGDTQAGNARSGAKPSATPQ